MINKVIAITVIVFSISSCGSSNNHQIVSSGPSNMTEDQKELISLPAQELVKGECAIFLWGKENSRPLVFSQTIKSGDAIALIDNSANTLIRQQASDLVIPGFYENQTFSFDRGIVSIKLRPEASRNLYEGIKIPSGIMNIKKNDGSENIVSVSGLLGCNLDD